MPAARSPAPPPQAPEDDGRQGHRGHPRAVPGRPPRGRAPVRRVRAFETIRGAAPVLSTGPHSPYPRLPRRFVLRGDWPWAYEPGGAGLSFLPRLYGLVVICSGVLPSLVLQFYVAFGVVGKGRKLYGYKYPVV